MEEEYIECLGSEWYWTAIKLFFLFGGLILISLFTLSFLNQEYHYLVYLVYFLFLIFNFKFYFVEKFFFFIIQPFFFRFEAGEVFHRARIFFKLDSDMAFSQKEYLKNSNILKQNKTALFVVTNMSYDKNREVKNNKEFCKKYNKIFHLFYKKYAYVYLILNQKNKSSFLLGYYVPTIYVIGIYFTFLLITSITLQAAYKDYPSVPKSFFLIFALFVLISVILILVKIWYTIIKDDSLYAEEIRKEAYSFSPEIKDFRNTFLIDFFYNEIYFQENRKRYFSSSLIDKEEKSDILKFIPALVGTLVLVFSLNILLQQPKDCINENFLNCNNKDTNVSRG